MHPQDLVLRELHDLDEFADVYALFDRVWRPEPGEAPVIVEQLHALAHTGNYVVGVYLDGRLVGASVAFLAMPVGEVLHSHVTATDVRRGVGFALKRHQRAWAIERGLSRITWTYDPLVRRNTYFNMVKLGARPEGYRVNFYGKIDDAINGGDETDRLLMDWRLTGPEAIAALDAPLVARAPADARAALSVAGDAPVARPTDAPVVTVDIPHDIETLRVTNPAAAKEWRYALRDVLGGLIADGATVTGFDPKAGYVVER
ncbi:GNAT family N-acetyltransferase [Yinghuangia sp. ASG 101]|uniref:GNAT family N-acetyltransferase n=1 Tax=Yinghuangia sp. ASG 101 TaxID=2896848 RepID=UPI001E4433A8|nr:GNAT family N-acetyltransferase [Yinghuangia sp. ASG 101]UGQ12602.1 GNAT family N-acetyltransferase [Yinghuangia sp. ASG 101]